MMFFIAPQLVFIDRLRITKKVFIFSIVSVALILLVFFVAYDNENAFSRELGLPTWLAMGYRALYLSSHAQWAVFESLYLSGDVVRVTMEQFLNFHKFLVVQLHPMDTSESLEKGVTFGMIYPAYLLYAVPAYLHPFAILIFAACLAAVFELFVWSVKSGRVVLAWVVCVILNTLARVLITGNFSLLFSGTMVLGILLAVVCILIAPKTNRADIGGVKKMLHPKICIVHDWLVTFGGAERVLAQMLKVYPNADIFSVVDFLESRDRQMILGKEATTTFIQRLPLVKLKYRLYHSCQLL